MLDAKPAGGKAVELLRRVDPLYVTTDVNIITSLQREQQRKGAMWRRRSGETEQTREPRCLEVHVDTQHAKPSRRQDPGSRSQRGRPAHARTEAVEGDDSRTCDLLIEVAREEQRTGVRLAKSVA